MALTTFLAALAAMAVNFSWQKSNDGYEYLVQLEPETIQLLQEGVDVPIDSYVPEGVEPIRRIRIVVGKAELPRENISANNEPAEEKRMERMAYFRPGEPAPPVDPRYAAPPAAAPPSTLDTIVKPLSDVNNFVEQGFEAGVNGLQKTGDAIRGAADSVSGTVQEQYQRSKEMLVGPSPSSSYRDTNPAGIPISGNSTAPAVASTSGWPSSPPASAFSATGAGTIPNLPPPPLAVPETPATTSSAPTSGPSGWDNRNSLPTLGADSNGRMVPIENASVPASAPEVPGWKPEWPAATATSAAKAFEDWPPRTTAAPASTSTTPVQTVGTDGTAATQNRSQDSTEKPPADETGLNASTIGRWGLAMVVLAGSFGLNCFLGFSYLDIRNKYRAALRRTSRSFGRPAASV